MISHFQLSVTLPTSRDEAWDVAVANQSVAYVNDAKLRQYSAANAAQRDIGTLAAQSLTSLMNGQQMINVLTDAHLGIAAPIDILHVVEQMKATIESSQGNLSEMEPPLNAALSNISPTAKH